MYGRPHVEGMRLYDASRAKGSIGNAAMHVTQWSCQCEQVICRAHDGISVTLLQRKQQAYLLKN